MPHFFEVIQLNKDTLRSRIATQPMGTWCQFITGHNTSVPSLARWAVNREKYTPAQLASFMEDGWRELGWHTGVHYLIPPDGDIVFELSDPSAPGIHSTCFNSDSIGIEMVGDYSYEKFDSGPGANVLDKFVYLTALLHNRLGLRPDEYVYGHSGLHWHFACQRDNHDCPGKPMRDQKPQIVARIVAKMAELKSQPVSLMAPEHGTDLAARYINAMHKRGLSIDTGAGEVNICYAEGMNPNGTPNANTPNEFNDLRMVIVFENGKPVLKGRWACTTEPGRYWTQHPMNPDGAARIAFGQYAAWQRGFHHSDPNHEALVQTGGPVTVYRDLKEDFKREGPTYSGEFGINQHRAYGEPIDNLQRSSAGCLVGWNRAQHQEFMALVKSDPRYKANNRYIFKTTVLPASEI